MKRTFVFILLSLLSFSGFAQGVTPVDYNQIKEQIDQYDELLTQFQNGEALTLDDYRLLYFGYTFQDNYKPYEPNPLNQEISDAMADGFSDENTVKLIDLSKKYLEQDPFSLKINNYLQNFIKNSQDDLTDLSRNLMFQYNGIIGAILSSGDGKTLETAYAVNHPSDEYMVLRFLKLKPLSSNFDATSDIFEVEDENGTKSQVFFDVTRMAQVGSNQMGIETMQVENEAIPENGVEIGSEAELLSFVPAGMKTLAEVEGDFDQDGDTDYILVLKKEGEEIISDAEAGKKEPRLLMLITREDNKLLESKYTNAIAIPCVDCGDGEDDPFDGLFLNDKGQLVLNSHGGDRFQWERQSTFEYKDGDFQLVKDEYTSFRRGKESEKDTDVETPKEFGEIKLEQFQFDN